MKIAYLGPLTLTPFQKHFDVTLPNTCQSSIYVSYIEHLLRQGHEVVICTIGEGNKKPFEAYSEKLTIFVAPESAKGKVRAFTKWHFSIRQMAAFLKKTPCDVYHAQWTYEYALAAMKVDVDKTLVTIHDDPETIYQMLPDYYRKQRLKMSRVVFQRAKHLSGNSPYIIKSVQRHQPHIHPWLVPNLIENKEKSAVSKDGNVIISINNGVRKNVSTLLEAFVLVKKELPDVVLHLYGAGYGMQQRVYLWAKDHNVPIEGVSFLGAQKYEVVQAALEQACMLVHPSLEESFGMTLVEAMVNGTPVIGGEHSGAVPWVLDGGTAGLLTDVTNPQMLANAIVQLHQSKELQQQLIENGYKRAQDFSVEKVAAQFLAVYQEIAQGE